MKELKSSPELQIEINRAKWIQSLRENGDRKITKIWYRRETNGVCANGLAIEMSLGSPCIGTGRDAAKFLGIEFIMKIAHDNDAGWSFAQIADAAQQGRYW